MSGLDFFALPFFSSTHQQLAAQVNAWGAQHLQALDDSADVDQTCRDLVTQLAQAGFLQHVVASGADKLLDTRAICILREGLARHAALADFALAMQGLGSAPISLFGSAAQQQAYLPRVAQGQAIAAFALSERVAGSDVANLQCRATPVAGGYLLDGEKAWISNGGIADFYIVFARTGEAPGARGISAFIVDQEQAGFHIAERVQLMAPHPMAHLRFDACFVPQTALIGVVGQGFKIAMASLDVFRSSVAAAALGMARAALAAVLPHVAQRQMFGQRLADLQLTQAKLAQMALAIDISALLTYRAAWLRDQGQSVTKEAAMAKLQATEQAQIVIDQALQLFGASAVVHGHVLERLYREIRALRIYEGASEVQQVIIARQMLAQAI